MIDSRITLEIPYIQALDAAQLQQKLTKKFDNDCFAAVRQSFTGSICGNAELVFPTQSATKLVAVLTGENLGSPDLDAVKIGTLSKISNIVINGVIGSIGNVVRQHLNYALPIYLEDTVENLLKKNNVSKTTILLAQARFTIEELEIMGDIILLFEVNYFVTLLAAIEQEVLL